MRHKVAIVFLSLVALTVSMTAWGIHRNYRIKAQFAGLRIGATESETVGLMGRPSRVEPCGKSFGTPKANCTEYIYRNSFAPFIPEYHSVMFDEDRRVMDMYVYESP